jgi:hypothetical protein
MTNLRDESAQLAPLQIFDTDVYERLSRVTGIPLEK